MPFWDRGVRQAIRAWLEAIFSTGVRCELKSNLAVGNSTYFSALIGTVAHLHNTWHRQFPASQLVVFLQIPAGHRAWLRSSMKHWLEGQGF